MKRPIRIITIFAALATLLAAGVHARTWTSADGAKTFEGELRTL